MKRFIGRVLLFSVVYMLVVTAISYSLLDKRNTFMNEYNHKVDLLKTTPRPRLIIIGGSSVAFGIDSKRIIDSLHVNVINFGLNAGLGIKFPTNDCLRFVQKGDVVVLQMEYENFFNNGNGDPILHFALLFSDMEYRVSLRHTPWDNIFVGINRNIPFKMKQFSKGNSKSDNENGDEERYEYSKDYFNEYGDEAHHWTVKHVKHIEGEVPTNKKEQRVADGQFIKWIDKTIKKFEKEGAKVVLLPPVCMASFFDEIYNDHIKDALREINRPYIVEPSYMVLDDSCMFDTRYHVNWEGVKQNTAHIISVFKNNPQLFAPIGEGE